MQNVTGKTTIKKNSKKIVSDIFFFHVYLWLPCEQWFQKAGRYATKAWRSHCSQGSLW